MGLRNTYGNTPTDLSRNNTVNVESLSSFPAPVGNVITLHAGNPTYNWTKSVNTGPYEFVIPDGNNVTFTTTNPVANTWTTEIAVGKTLLSGAVARVEFNGLDVTSINGGKCFSLTAGVGVIPILFKERMRVIGFDDIGDLDGLTFVSENVAYISNGAGWLLNNVPVMDVAEQNYLNQVGDHITMTGTSSYVIFRDTIGNPSIGDQLFNLDALTVAAHSRIENTMFTDVNGGTSGLTKTYTSNQTLDNIFTDIKVNTTSGAVQIEMPDTSTTTIPEGYFIDITDTGNASTNAISVIPNALDSTTINNGLTRYRITEDNGSVLLQRHGNTWEIINRFNQKSISTPLTATSALTELDDVTIANTSGGAFTTTAPTAVGRRGKFFVLKKLQGSANKWTIIGTGGETFDNATAINFLGSIGKAVTIMSDGTNWLIIEAV